MSDDLNWRPHSLVSLDDDRVQCETCKRTWKTEPHSMCPGIPVYPGLWSDVWPDGLMTKKQLNAAGFSTGKKLPSPAALLHWSNDKSGAGYLRLYDPGEATEKRKLSDAQKAALAKAQAATYRNWHCNRCDRRVQVYGTEHCPTCDAVIFAGQLLQDDRAVILDTETTGLYSDDEIIELAVINLNGAVLFDRRIRPHDPSKLHRTSDSGMCASDIHGIHPEDLEGEPMFADVYPDLVAVLGNRHVIVYNAAYDLPLLDSVCRLDDLPMIRFERQTCAMELYAQWWGEWSYRHRSYRWQPLPGGDHSALGDCRATLDVLRKMASDV